MPSYNISTKVCPLPGFMEKYFFTQTKQKTAMAIKMAKPSNTELDTGKSPTLKTTSGEIAGKSLLTCKKFNIITKAKSAPGSGFYSFGP